MGTMLTGEEQAAVAGYSQGRYRLINACLRGEEPDLATVWPEISHIDSAVSKAVIDREMTFYRGLDGEAVAAIFRAGLRIGQVISDEGFASTSSEAKVARRFSALMAGGLLMEIRAGAGSIALDLSPYSAYPDEGEFLLARGVAMRVVGFVEASRMIQVELI